MKIYVANTYYGDEKDCVQYIEKLQSKLNGQIMEWNRSRSGPSKVFQINNANIHFDPGLVMNYSSSRWCPNNKFIIPPDSFDESSFSSYIHIFITKCRESDDYDNRIRDKINRWLALLKTMNDQTDFMILHLVFTDGPVSVKNFFARPVFERIKRDFGNLSLHGRCVQLTDPHKKSDSFNDLIDSLVELHHSSLVSLMGTAESNFFGYWSALKTDPFWSPSVYFKHAFFLFTLYQKMTFLDEMCETYSYVYSNIFEYILVTPLENLPTSLKSIIQRTKILIDDILKSDQDALDMLNSEICSTLMNPINSNILQGIEVPKTIYSLIFSIIGANVHCFQWNKNFPKFFRRMCRFVLEVETFLKRIYPEASDVFLASCTVNAYKWLLSSLNDVIHYASSNNHIPSTVSSGLCDLLSLLCQFLNKCLFMCTKINVYGYENSKLISLSDDTLFNEDFIDQPVNKHKEKVISRSTNSFTDPSSPEVTVNIENSFSLISMSDHPITSGRSFSDMRSLNVSNRSFACSQDIRSLITSSPFHTQSVSQNLVPFEPVKKTIEHIISELKKLPILFYKDDISQNKVMTSCTLVVYYQTSLLFDYCGTNRSSVIQFCETARLFSLLKRDLQAMDLYSTALSFPSIWYWPKTWFRILVHHLESTCGVKILSETRDDSRLVTGAVLKFKKLPEKLKSYMIDSPTATSALTSLIYIASACTKINNSKETTMTFLDLFEVLAKNNSHEVEVNADPIIEFIKIDFGPNNDKLNAATVNSLNLSLTCNFLRPVSFDSISLIFRRTKSVFSAKNRQPYLAEGNIPSIFLFESLKDTLEFRRSDFILRPGNNSATLYSSDSFVTELIIEKVIMRINACSLFYFLNTLERRHIQSIFSPPKFYVPENTYLIYGMSHVLKLNINNSFSLFKQSNDFHILVFADQDVVFNDMDKKVSIDNCPDGLDPSFILRQSQSQNQTKNDIIKNTYELILDDFPAYCSADLNLTCHLKAMDNYSTISNNKIVLNMHKLISISCIVPEETVNSKFEIPCHNCFTVSHLVHQGGKKLYLQIVLTNVIRVPFVVKHYEVNPYEQFVKLIDLNTRISDPVHPKEELSLIYEMLSDLRAFECRMRVTVAISEPQVYGESDVLIKFLVNY